MNIVVTQMCISEEILFNPISKRGLFLRFLTNSTTSILIKLLFVCVHVCHTFQYNLTNFESFDILSVNNTYTNGVTKDILSMSNTYTNGATLPVSQLEQGGALAPL